MLRYVRSLIIVLWLTISLTPVLGQSPHILSVGLASSNVPKHEKLEAMLDLTASYQNPYDYRQIHVRAVFESPSSHRTQVDGFYREGYDLTNPQTGAISPNTEDGFVVRFAPNEIGNWRVKFMVQDQHGVDSTEWQSFQCAPSARKGYLRTGTGSYLTFDNGDPYIGIGHNIAWPNTNPVADYSKWLGALKNNGGNFLRLWHCHWGLSLEWRNNGYQGLMQYKQNKAFYLDWLHDYCEQNDLYMMICLQHHGQVSSQVNPNWSESPYNAVNGGFCSNTWDFFKNDSAKIYTKNRLRYIVARWGYSSNVMAWELFNEVNWTDDYLQHQGPINDWHEEMAAFLKEIDPNKHLVTTSYASEELGDLTWTLPDMDLTQIHYYLPSPNLERVIAAGTRKYRETYDKPCLVGEFGINTQAVNYATLDPGGIYIHNGLWGGFFGGGMGTGASWWWDNYMHPQDLYFHYEGFKRVLDLLPVEEDLIPTQAQVRGAEGDLSLTPTLGWGIVGSTTIPIQNGQIQQGAALSNYLYGASWNTQFRSPPTFQIEYPQGGEFIVRTGTEKGESPQVVIYLDGVKVLDQSGQTNQTYTIQVPAGLHDIKVDNEGTDWISISEYVFEGLGSKIDVYPLHSPDKKQWALWAIHNAYNHQNVKDNGIPNPVNGAQIVINDIPDGAYFAKWYNSLTGGWIRTEAVFSQDDTMRIAIPPITWDMTVVIDTQNVTSNDPLWVQQELKVFPNPIQDDLLSFEFEHVSFEAGEYNLINALGQSVLRAKLPDGSVGDVFRVQIPRSLPNGHYWLKVNKGKRVGVRLIELAR